MSPKDLEKLAKVCQKYGISRIKTADIELSFDTSSFAPPTTKPADTPAPLSDELSYTDEEIALWSAAGINS